MILNFLNALNRTATMAREPTDGETGGAIPRIAPKACDDLRGLARTGIIGGTFIACEHGWRPAESIMVGDRVHTFDSGLQPVVQLRRSTLWTEETTQNPALQHYLVPRHALGNRAPMRLLPEQKVLVESDSAEALFDDPFALMPIAALEGYRGITRVVPLQPTEIVVIGFAEEEIVYANGSALIHCAWLGADTAATPEELMRSGSDNVYPKLSAAALAQLVACLHREETGAMRPQAAWPVAAE